MLTSMYELKCEQVYMPLTSHILAFPQNIETTKVRKTLLLTCIIILTMKTHINIQYF